MTYGELSILVVFVYVDRSLAGSCEISCACFDDLKNNHILRRVGVIADA